MTELICIICGLPIVREHYFTIHSNHPEENDSFDVVIRRMHAHCYRTGQAKCFFDWHERGEY